jgi:ribosomal protein S18 acetylase RimI-like enzyme
MDEPVQLIRPHHDPSLVDRGLRVLVGGPEQSPGIPTRGTPEEITEKLDGFITYAQSIHLDSRRQVLAFRSCPSGENVIAGMCLWVPAPGRTATLFAPDLSDFPQAAAATQQAVAAALTDARDAGIVLVQALVEPADAAGRAVFSATGLALLATLTYMERLPPPALLHTTPPDCTLPTDLTLTPYTPATHTLFREAILRSYEGTLDCPALSNMRDIDDVIEGHKAVGLFDPQLWGVLLRDGKPLGCLLLAEIPARQGLELVYLGLVPEARGRGLGRLLMQRVLAIAARRHFAVATLAVDAANQPALRLYRRCGYTSTGQRVALVKRLI